MKSWKLISGIISLAMTAIIFVQSAAAGMYDALGGGSGSSMSAGVMVAVLMIAAGIVSIVTRKSTGKGGNIALIVLFGLAAVTGFAMHGVYADLVVWAAWCLICAVMAVVAMVKTKKN